jgi:hypothetical protein
MTVQNASQVTLGYKVEGTLNTPPGASGAQLLRRTTSSLGPVKDSFASNEVRQDQQIADVRHGMRSARGQISGELSTVTYDAFIEAVLRGTWNTGVAASPADFATGMTVANSGALNSTLTMAGAGNLLTKGFRVGDIVRSGGFTTAANNAATIGNLRIVALTATVMTVYPQLAATAQQAAGWTVIVPGSKLVYGTTKRSFTLEQSLPDALLFERFSGARIGGMTINAGPQGMTTVDFDVMAMSFLEGTSAAYFTAPTVETTTGILSGVDGFIRLNGEEQGVVTGLQLNLTDNLSMSPVIGSTFAPDVFYGRSVVTGSVSVYLEDGDLPNAFVNESEIDLVAVLEASGPNPQEFLSFNFQRIKFTSFSKQIGADGGVVAQFPFQALLKSASNGFDATTLTIQRSN